MFVQEPSSTALDEAFLRDMGLTVLHEPEAKEHLTKSAFTYIPFGGFDLEYLDVPSSRMSPSRMPRLHIGLDLRLKAVQLL